MCWMSLPRKREPQENEEAQLTLTIATSPCSGDLGERDVSGGLEQLGLCQGMWSKPEQIPARGFP